MTDSTQVSTPTDDQTPQSAQPQPDPSGVQKSPLDILEELLKESKGGESGGAEPAASNSTSSTSTGNSDAGQALSPEEQAALDAQEAARKQSEQQQLEQTLQELKSVEQSPQYKARVDQEQEEQQTKAHEQEELDGHHIHQLSHTKI